MLFGDTVYSFFPTAKLKSMVDSAVVSSHNSCGKSDYGHHVAHQPPQDKMIFRKRVLLLYRPEATCPQLRVIAEKAGLVKWMAQCVVVVSLHVSGV
jgi:hypothetical protein